ncbi:LTA synthase family protein [Cytobacillus firmus]|uniref:LTA synthase family protein n=1 Tax=Cytobacillus firmus TaxID=1399 RepID=UPI0018CD27B6|nr:LTA synthase family protein [Cytobacillus firmus]
MKLIKKHYPALLSLALLTFFFSLCWAFKTFYFIYELELNPHKKLILVSSGGLGTAVTGLIVFRKKRVQTVLAFIVYLLLSFLLYADVLYERYYDAILNFQLVQQANQLGDVKDSIASLVYVSDIFYWIDIPAILLALYVFSRKERNLRNPLIGSAMFAAGTAFILFAAFYPLKDTFSDQYKVSLTGILPAHIYDLSRTYHNLAAAKEITAEEKTELEILKDYFNGKQDLLKSSPYFGKLKGKNIIVVQAESLNDFPIGLEVNGEEITPHLNELISTSHYYPNIYLQIGRGNTSDAEFAANNSLYPIADMGVYKTYPKNNFLSLPQVLKKEGYATSAAHGNSPEFWNRRLAYPNQGFDNFYSTEHLKINEDEVIGMGVSDRSMFKQMIDIYKEEEKPFYSFIVSLTNHRPFDLPGKYQSLDLPAEFTDTLTGNYLQATHYFDQSIGYFIEKLKEEHIWDDSIFVVYGDHYGPIPKDKDEIDQLLGINFNQKEQFNVPMIIHHPGQTAAVKNEIIGSQLDIFPTLASLIGTEQPLAHLGASLDIKKEGFAGFAYETTPYSYYSGPYDYAASHNGVFQDGICTDNKTGEKVSVNACKKTYDQLIKDVQLSEFLLKNNLIGELFK